MNPSTKRSLAQLAELVPHLSFDFENDGTTVIALYADPDRLPRRIEVHQLPDGKWIQASWNARAAQWQSSDLGASFRRANSGISGVFGGSLSAIATDVRKHRSAADAIRAALELEEQR